MYHPIYSSYPSWHLDKAKTVVYPWLLSGPMKFGSLWLVITKPEAQHVSSFGGIWPRPSISSPILVHQYERRLLSSYYYVPDGGPPSGRAKLTYRRIVWLCIPLHSRLSNFLSWSDVSDYSTQSVYTGTLTCWALEMVELSTISNHGLSKRHMWNWPETAIPDLVPLGCSIR